MLLVQERGRLESWRDLVRRKYQEVGNNGDVPAELPRQLTVSQRVTARLPVTRQLHDGDILTVAPDCYRYSPPASTPPRNREGFCVPAPLPGQGGAIASHCISAS